MQPFDYFIAIDWSSRATPSPKKPSRDAIWVGEGRATGRVTAKYFRTREGVQLYLKLRLCEMVKRQRRTLVGWDFAFGYPAGLAEALRLGREQPWLRVWELLDQLITDRADNDNNRFAVGNELNGRITGRNGPFWGVPRGQAGPFLGARKDFDYPVVTEHVRLAERRLVELRAKKMQPPWKLAYTGSVGGQSLVGIPRLHDLAFTDEMLRVTSLIWPFQTDFFAQIPATGPLVLHAEIYPSHLVVPREDEILDREQVSTYVKWLRAEQQTGQLERWLTGPINISNRERGQILGHEGWVLGIE
ncbi:hypothetical protein [Neolewinella antarctica]|uniref:Uncharacterized protein n=1 Tax=Neolewinella antarctica TaxID=442734 RepID=A0ABX0XC94_9BACT|nr:hypothetical protein [Neolewinella antarctica]NJC26569.1 hypothetical protein [Neolewinella antarctica]